MFNFVPFTRARRKVAYRDVQSDGVGKLLQLPFPPPHPITITPTTVGADQQRADPRVQRLAYMDPPASNAFDGETGGVILTAYIDPAPVLAHIIHPIRDGFSQVFIRKI